MTHRMLSFVAAVAVAALPTALRAEPGAPAAQHSAPAAALPVPAVRGADAAKDVSKDVPKDVPRAKADAASLVPDEQRARIQQFVVKEKKPSTSIAEKVAVGVVLPKTVELYALPADLGAKSAARYAVVNERAVLVDAGSRKVTDFIN